MKKEIVRHPIERTTTWIGSVPSLALHTIIFVAFFFFAITGVLTWDRMLLVLTTILSLEAIYLAIFIQMTVNRHTQSLQEVEADMDEIQENIDEIQEDVEEMTEDEKEHNQQIVTLEALTNDIHKILTDLEELKKGKYSNEL